MRGERAGAGTYAAVFGSYHILRSGAGDLGMGDDRGAAWAYTVEVVGNF